MYRPSIEHCKTLLSYLPKRPNYYEWLLAISSVANTFSEATALNLLKNFFIDEKANETLYKIRHKLHKVNYGALVNLAKKYGYRHHIRQFNIKQNLLYKNNDKGILYRFSDYEFEERAAIIEYESGFTRQQAENEILKNYLNAEKERVYRIAINKKIRNKNLNPKNNMPYKDFTTFTNNWENKILSLDEIVDAIKKGYSFIPAHLKGNYRKESNFECSELFAIDIDKNIRIEEALEIDETSSALLIYTTVNHTDKLHRFRILFALPELIRDKELYKQTVSKYIKIYNADENCKDALRGFYGNTNSIIIDIINKKII